MKILLCVIILLIINKYIKTLNNKTICMNEKIEYKNKGNYFTNGQLEEIFKFFNSDYRPRKIIIFEKRIDIIVYLFNGNILTALIDVLSIFRWLGRIEGGYLRFDDIVLIYIFSQNDEGNNKYSKQFYSLYTLIHEIRHRWQIVNNFTEDKEDDADDFADKFMDINSKQISKIMKWKEQ